MRKFYQKRLLNFKIKIQAHHIRNCILNSNLHHTRCRKRKSFASEDAHSSRHKRYMPRFLSSVILIFRDDCVVLLVLTQADLTPRRAVFPSLSSFTKLSPQSAINDKCRISICKILKPWQYHLIDLWSRMRCHVGLPRVGSISWCCKNIR